MSPIDVLFYLLIKMHALFAYHSVTNYVKLFGDSWSYVFFVRMASAVRIFLFERTLEYE